MQKEKPKPINTVNDTLMVSEGLRQPKINKLPAQVYQKTPQQRKDIRKLSKDAKKTFENKIMHRIAA
jgi:hypothetical protein